MPTIEELWLQLEVQGIGEIQKASEAVDKVTAATDRARDAQGKFVAGDGGGKTVKQQAQDVYDFADAYEVLGDEMKGVFTTAQQVGLAQKEIANTRIANGTDDQLTRMAAGLDKVEKAGAKAKGGVAGFGQTALQTGRVVQDFAQGGIGGILNNIEGLTMALGMGSGLAGVLTILGVGFMVLKPQIMEFWEALNAGAGKEAVSNFDRLTERIKELKDAPLKMAVDRRELDEAEKQLDRLKRGRAEFEAGQKRQTVEQAESGKVVDETLTAAGQPEAEAAMKRALIGKMEATDDPLAEIRKKIAIEDANAAQAKKDMQGGSLEDTMAAEAQLKIAEGNRKDLVNQAQKRKDAIEANAGDEIGSAIDIAKTGNASGDRNQAAAQKKIAELLEKAGMGGLARDIRGSSPEALKKADDDIEAAQDFGDRATRAGAARRARAEREQKERKAAEAKKKADGAPMDDAVRVFKGEQEAARAKRKADGAPMDDAVRIFKGQQEAKKGEAIRRRAGQIEGQSAFFTGQQFSPEQAQHAAQRSIALQARGLNANQATVQAMGEMMATMAGFGAKLQHIEQQIEGVRGHNRQVNRRLQQGQPSSLRSGGPQ